MRLYFFKICKIAKLSLSILHFCSQELTNINHNNNVDMLKYSEILWSHTLDGILDCGYGNKEVLSQTLDSIYIFTFKDSPKKKFTMLTMSWRRLGGMVVKLLKILTVPLHGDKWSASHTLAVSSTEGCCLVVKVKFQCPHRTSTA